MTKSVFIRGVEWNSNRILELLERNDSAVIRGMLRIYQYQTEEEKIRDVTISENGVGFSSYHGKIMSSLSEFYINQGFLTEKQIAVARKIMKHYAAQLLRIISHKQ